MGSQRQKVRINGRETEGGWYHDSTSSGWFKQQWNCNRKAEPYTYRKTIMQQIHFKKKKNHFYFNIMKNSSKTQLCWGSRTSRGECRGRDGCDSQRVGITQEHTTVSQHRKYKKLERDNKTQAIVELDAE